MEKGLFKGYYNGSLQGCYKVTNYGRFISDVAIRVGVRGSFFMMNGHHGGMFLLLIKPTSVRCWVEARGVSQFRINAPHLWCLRLLDLSGQAETPEAVNQKQVRVGGGNSSTASSSGNDVGLSGTRRVVVLLTVVVLRQSLGRGWQGAWRRRGLQLNDLARSCEFG